MELELRRWMCASLVRNLTFQILRSEFGPNNAFRLCQGRRPAGVCQGFRRIPQELWQGQGSRVGRYRQDRHPPRVGPI